MKLYKYYLMERPPGPGCQPAAGLFKTEDYGYKRDDCMGGVARTYKRLGSERPTERAGARRGDAECIDWHGGDDKASFREGGRRA